MKKTLSTLILSVSIFSLGNASNTDDSFTDCASFSRGAAQITIDAGGSYAQAIEIYYEVYNDCTDQGWF